METFKVNSTSSKNHLSRESSPNRIEQNKDPQYYQKLNAFNDEIIQMLDKTDLKQLSILKIDQDLDSLKEKYIKSYGENFQRTVKSSSNIMNSIKKLVERSYKYIFQFYTEQLENFGVPKKNSIIVEIEEYLDNNIINSKINENLDTKIKQNILYECQIFVYILTQIPAMYVEFFENDFFDYIENIDILGDSIDLNKCTEIIINKIQSYLTNLLPINSEFILKITKYYFESFIEFINSKISIIFKECKEIMDSNIEEFKKKTDQAILCNRFVIIGLLKELSKKCKAQILEKLNNTFFVLIDQQISQKFANFIIQSNEIIELKHKKNLSTSQDLKLDHQELGEKINKEKQNDQEVINEEQLKQKLTEEQFNQNPIKEQTVEEQMNQKPIDEQIDQKLSKIMKSNEEVVITNLVKEDGHQGYLIEKKDGQSFLLHKNKNGNIVVLNSKYMPRGWLKYENEEDVKAPKTYDQLLSTFKNKQLSSFFTQQTQYITPPDMTKATQYYMSSAVGDIGGSLGFCLANINRYENTQAFLKDFGKTATINGSISLIIQKLPIFGTLMLVGGLGFATFQIYRNKVANKKRKMCQLGKVALNTGSAITGSFSGAVVGQALIPIPFLGAFIGGLIGGLIAGTSSHFSILMIDKTKFKLMIHKIEKNINTEGYWEYSKKMLSCLGVKLEFFQKSIPENLESKNYDKQDIWMTLCCYGLLTTYYSTHEQKDRQVLNEQLQKSENEKEQQEILDKLEYSKDWNQAIEKSQNFLLDKNIPVIQYLHNMEELIKHVVNEA